MKRRKFLQSSLTTGAAVSTGSVFAESNHSHEKEIYELREYEMNFGSDQAQLHNYFKSALIPALNKYGVKAVGVFNEWGKSDPAKIYVLISYPSLELSVSINAKVKADPDYIENSAVYNNIPADKSLYSRFNASLMIAFDGFPKLIAPSEPSRIIELRTYEGYSEDAVRRKIKMFNDGEFPIFERAGLSGVFFGEVIAGNNLPRLTYMLSVKNMEERDKGWGAFVADPEWKRLLADPQYAHTISKIIKTFLVPTPYSQI